MLALTLGVPAAGAAGAAGAAEAAGAIEAASAGAYAGTDATMMALMMMTTMMTEVVVHVPNSSLARLVWPTSPICTYFQGPPALSVPLAWLLQQL